MGCASTLCQKQRFNYSSQEKLLMSILSQFSNLTKCYSNDFVIKCHKHLLQRPQEFILRYEKKLQLKQIIPHIVIQKWKLILYGTNIENEDYIDCLGFDKQVQQQRMTSKTYRFSTENPFEIRIQDLYFHQSYRQIEKDAGRAYLVPQLKQQLFQKVLKKIANHFPESGYSLGINYIVGYFLLIGLSQIDSFWMFVHLALNQKYLALGFFQHELPLTKVIIQVFKNLLKRKNILLFNHMYKNMEINDESWILKWIISFYLSIFPIQFCHYIFDYIITYGILGLANIAFSIVNQFQSQIYKCQDEVEFNIKLKEFFGFQTFSKNIDILKFMNSVYLIELKYQDFVGICRQKNNFYSQYFNLYSQWVFKNSIQCKQKSKQLLSNWYKSKVEKRYSFAIFAKSAGSKFFSSRQKQKQKSQSNSNSSKNNEETSFKNQKLSKKNSSSQKLTHISIKNLQMPLNSSPETIKINSKSKCSIQKSNNIKNQYKKTKQFTFFQENQIQKQYSQKILPEKIIFQKRLSKTQKSDDQFFNQIQKKNVNKLNIFGNQGQFLQTQKKETLSQDDIVFNQRPLKRKFSLQQKSKTLDLIQKKKAIRRNSQFFAWNDFFDFASNLKRPQQSEKNQNHMQKQKNCKQNEIKKLQENQSNVQYNEQKNIQNFVFEEQKLVFQSKNSEKYKQQKGRIQVQKISQEKVS